MLKDVPKNKAEEVGRMLRAIYSQESRESALEKAASVVTRLKVYVPTNLGKKKHGRDYRFLAVRERWDARKADRAENLDRGPWGNPLRHSHEEAGSVAVHA